MTVIPVTASAQSGGGPTWPIAIPQPPLLQAGDLILVNFASGAAMAGVTAPTGFSQTRVGNVSNTSIFTETWWKIAGGSEPSSYSFNATNNTNPATWTCTVYRGCDQVTPIDATFTTVTGSTTPDTAPAITTVTSNCLIVSKLVSVNNITWSPPSTSPATTIHISTGGGDDEFTQSPVATGTIAARTFTPSGASGRWIGYTIALRPASGTAHTGLTGTGSITVAQPAAIQVTVTGISNANGPGAGFPLRYFKLGNIAWGTGNGAIRNYYLSHATELIVAPISDATVIYYSFGNGLTGAITELSTP